MCLTPGFTCSRFSRKRSTEKSRCGSRSILLKHNQLAGTEHQRVLQRLVLALGDRGDHRAGVLTDAELRGAPQVADVLDHRAGRSPAGPSHREAQVHDVGVQVALAAEARGRVELRDGNMQGRQAVGVERALRCRPRGRRRGTPADPPSARAPGGLSCPRRARPSGSRREPPRESKSSRLARAIVSFASSTSVATFTLVLCTAPPRPRVVDRTAARRRRPSRPRHRSAGTGMPARRVSSSPRTGSSSALAPA